MFHKRIVFQETGLRELKKDYTFVDMHIHSRYSHDSRTHVSAILHKAQKMSIGVAVTDHVRAEGSFEACKQNKVFVIPGIEVNCLENKEILLYFYSVNDLRDFYEKHIEKYIFIKKEGKKRITKIFGTVMVNKTMAEIIDQAEMYNCLKSVAHPYTFPPRRSHLFFNRRKRRNLLNKIDAIEVLNASLPTRANRQAVKWARKSHKAFTAGSDAHMLKEVGESTVAARADNVEDFLEAIRKRTNLVIGEEIKLSTVVKEFMKSQNYKSRIGIRKLEHFEEEVLHESL